MKALRLRVKDLDFDYSQIVVRDGKGRKDRVTILPEAVMPPLQRQLARLAQDTGRFQAARRSPTFRCPCSSVTSFASPSVKPKHEINRAASSPRAAPVIACS